MIYSKNINIFLIVCIIDGAAPGLCPSPPLKNRDSLKNEDYLKMMKTLKVKMTSKLR